MGLTQSGLHVPAFHISAASNRFAGFPLATDWNSLTHFNPGEGRYADGSDTTLSSLPNPKDYVPPSALPSGASRKRPWSESASHCDDPKFLAPSTESRPVPNSSNSLSASRSGSKQPSPLRPLKLRQLDNADIVNKRRKGESATTESSAIGGLMNSDPKVPSGYPGDDNVRTSFRKLYGKSGYKYYIESNGTLHLFPPTRESRCPVTSLRANDFRGTSLSTFIPSVDRDPKLPTRCTQCSLRRIHCDGEYPCGSCDGDLNQKIPCDSEYLSVSTGNADYPYEMKRVSLD